MKWIDRNEMMPDEEGKYPVIIFMDGKKEVSLCSFNAQKQRFHFDMPNINWKITHWFKLPKIDL